MKKTLLKSHKTIVSSEKLKSSMKISMTIIYIMKLEKTQWRIKIKLKKMMKLSLKNKQILKTTDILKMENYLMILVRNKKKIRLKKSPKVM